MFGDSSRVDLAGKDVDSFAIEPPILEVAPIAITTDEEVVPMSRDEETLLGVGLSLAVNGCADDCITGNTVPRTLGTIEALTLTVL